MLHALTSISFTEVTYSLKILSTHVTYVLCKTSNCHEFVLPLIWGTKIRVPQRLTPKYRKYTVYTNYKEIIKLTCHQKYFRWSVANLSSPLDFFQKASILSINYRIINISKLMRLSWTLIKKNTHKQPKRDKWSQMIKLPSFLSKFFT